MEASNAMVSSPSGRFWPAACPPHVARSRKNEAKTTPAFAIMDSSRAHCGRVGERYMVGGRATSRASATYMVAPAALAGVVALATTVAWGDVGHAHAPDESTQVPRVVWLLGIALTILVALLLLRQARRGGDYLGRVRGFSRNARLLLLRTPFSGLSVSIWRLLFYLYLLAAGHDTLFVAQLASINWIAHGLSVIPSGILSDLFGRRRVFLVSYAGNILGTAGLILVHEPMALLVVAAVQGAFEGGHAIVGPPFMVEQSRPGERVHLFSIGGFMTVGGASLGNLLAGVLPVGLRSLPWLGAQHPGALPAGPLFCLSLVLLSAPPVYLIDARWQPLDIRRL